VPFLPALQQRIGLTWRLLLKELSAFGVVGAASFALDLLVFQLLYVHVGIGAVTAKLISTLVSMTAAYVGHRYWSFSHRARTGLRREYLLFAVINGVTLLIGVAIVGFVRYPLGQENALVLQVANVASTVVGTLIRYFSYRRWVFPAVEPAQPLADATETAAPAQRVRKATPTGTV
jgi:putative flippase GtrA